jgi:mRNA interferase YafQ
MRRIEPTTAVRRDFKREKKGQHRRDVDLLVSGVVSLLAEDSALPEKNRDHGLGGDWHDHRECHLKPDLLLNLPQAGRPSFTTGPHGIAQ